MKTLFCPKTSLAVLLLALAPLAAAQAPATGTATAANANACTDFDTFANGAWNAANEIPANRARIGSFDALRNANDVVLAKALAELVGGQRPAASPGLKLLTQFYKSGIDVEAINQAGLSPVAPLLKRIAQATSADVPAIVGELSALRVPMPLSLSVRQDAKDATRHLLALSPGGLGLPAKDDYVSKAPAPTKVRASYRQYLVSLLRAANLAADEASAASAADAVIALEAHWAAATLAPAERRDPAKLYHPQTVLGLGQKHPEWQWPAQLTGFLGPKSAAEVAVIAVNEAIGTVMIVASEPAHLAAVAASAPRAEGKFALPVWKHYLALRVLDAFADKLPPAFANAHFAYRQTALRGLTQQPARSEQVILAIGGGFGEGPLSQTLGELFVGAAFPQEAQRKANLMIEDIRAAMKARIANLPWMSPATQVLAQAKLANMAAHIGGPKAWPDYSALTLGGSYAGNVLAANAWAHQRDVADLFKPVDRNKWFTSPHIVNAFAGGGNKIVFPAGILQPPFFDVNASDAANYGAIGTVIGHEITHHFDDRGRKFDAVGNLTDWWAQADASAYQERATRLANFYSNYEPVPGTKINGVQMLGENISDLGGVQIAYDGLQMALKRAGQSAKPQAAAQEFFMANALIWRGKSRVEAIVQQLRTGQHSPGRYRVLGPLTHTPAFAAAFNCKSTDAMVAAEPILIW